MPSHRIAQPGTTLTKRKGPPVMLRLVPPVPPRPPCPPRPPAPPRHTDHALADDCLARSAAFGTATGAFEAMMDWVEGRP